MVLAAIANICALFDKILLCSSSEGLQGIAVEITVRVYRQELIKSRQKIMATSEMLKSIHNIIGPNSNAWMLVRPDLSLVEQRTVSPENTRSPEVVGGKNNEEQAKFTGTNSKN